MSIIFFITYAITHVGVPRFLKGLLRYGVILLCRFFKNTLQPQLMQVSWHVKIIFCTLALLDAQNKMAPSWRMCLFLTVYNHPDAILSKMLSTACVVWEDIRVSLSRMWQSFLWARHSREAPTTETALWGSAMGSKFVTKVTASDTATATDSKFVTTCVTSWVTTCVSSWQAAVDGPLRLCCLHTSGGSDMFTYPNQTCVLI